VDQALSDVCKLIPTFFVIPGLSSSWYVEFCKGVESGSDAVGSTEGCKKISPLTD